VDESEIALATPYGDIKTEDLKYYAGREDGLIARGLQSDVGTK